MLGDFAAHLLAAEERHLRAACLPCAADEAADRAGAHHDDVR
jgi:hypothetical protein